MRSIRMLALISVIGVAPLAAQTAEKPALLAPVTLTAADSVRYIEMGKTYTRWLLSGKADSLVAFVHPDALERLGGVDGIKMQAERIAERAGTETKVVEDKLTRRNGRLQLWHAGQFSEMTGEDFVIRWLVDENGKIVGAGLGPRANTPPVDA